MTGWRTLFYKEVLRFWKVSVQTVAAPVLTALLYLLIFCHVLRPTSRSIRACQLHGLPGAGAGDDERAAERVRQQLVQSLIQSKITGNIVFVLLPPLSHLEFFLAYVGAAVVRGLVVGLGVFAGDAVVRAVPAAAAAVDRWCSRCWARRSWARSASIAGIWAEKFDQLAAFQNFIIMPLTFLSGVFYSIHSLPPFWQAVSPPQSVLLHDRRLPLRLLRRQSDVSPWLEPGWSRCLLRGDIARSPCSCCAAATKSDTEAQAHP